MSDLTPESSFERLKGNVVNSIKSNFPLEGRKNSLVLENVHVQDDLSISDIKSQLDAKDKDGTWAVPVKGDVKLIDKTTGAVIDHRKGVLLAKLPKLTERYGYIVGGTEYQVDHLLKLKSGVYTRVKNNGELETEFNLKFSPTKKGFALNFDPKTMKFSMEYPRGSGGITLPLYPIMKSVGLSDEELEHSWGKQIFDINKVKSEKTFYNALRKFWNKTSDEEREPSNEDLVRNMTDFFGKTQLRPDTTKVTMGKAFESVTPEALKIGAEKVLGISKGTHKPDERDSLVFKEVVSIDDFLPAKLDNNMWKIKARLRNSLDHKAKVSDILSPDIFGRHINEFFTGGKSGVSERSDQTNPLQMLSAHTKTTVMSKDFGGLKNEQSIGLEMRMISPSHFGFLDPSHTPEGSKTGITLHLSSMARKNNKELEVPVYDVKTGRPAWSTVSDFHTKTAVLPDQVSWVNGKPVPISAKVKVKLPGGDIEHRPFKDADYVMHSSKGIFDHATNLIPFLASDQGNRVSMAGKQMEQAVSLKYREAPLVQCKTDNVKDPTHTYEKLVGSFAAHKAVVDGAITEVAPEHIKIKSKEGEHTVQIYDNFPLNDQKVMMHSTPTVKVGDQVRKGQVIADSNFTDKGVLSLGVNLRYGLMGYKGYNFDDGVVISESAAKKLTSEHLHRKELEIDPQRDVISAVKLKAFAPVSVAKMTKDQWSALDKDGIIKVGQKVLPGQIMVAALGENIGKGSLLARLGNKAIKPYKDKSLVWDEDHVGEVTRVIKLSNGGVRVCVKTEEQMVVGDKVAGRHGDKGIATCVLPDHEMPFTKDENGERKPLELLFNPLGIPSRMNVGQMYEIAGAKIAQKTGKPYIVNNFHGADHNYHSTMMKEMEQHGVSDQEEVYDPSNPNKPLGSIMVGPKYTLKLRHQVEKKLHVRGGGSTVEGNRIPYGVDRQPTKGGGYGGQGYGQLDLYALLGYDARNNIREMSTYKSDLQDGTFWDMIQQGHEPPPPRPPFTYEKFTALLRAAGVNVTKEGTAIKLSPMTDKETLTLAGNGKNQIVKEEGTVYSGRLLLRAKDLREEKDGFFDPMATGGIDGTKWSYFKLAEPIPNPVFVGQGNIPGPVPILLNLKRTEIDAIMEGKQKLNGKVGGAAIHEELKKVDVDKEISSIRVGIKDLRGGDLDRQNRKLRFLLALKEMKLKPAEAYMMNYVPVIPPVFRPVTEANRGDLVVAPLNNLYKHAAQLNDKLLTFDHTTFTAQHAEPIRANLWNAMKAISSVGSYAPVYDSDGKGDRELVGILDQLATGGGEGGQPKKGFVHDKLVKRRQDLSMRTTIVPEPTLHMDEVGIPRGPAMEMYKPYVVAQLGRWGITPLDAQKKIKSKEAIADKALEKVVEERPVIMKRDPVLHKFNVVGLRPKLVDGKAIQVHPLITGGMNADFDGDCVRGEIIVATGDGVCYGNGQGDLTMPHNGKVISYQVIDIAKFPRLEETRVVKESGTIEYDAPPNIYVPAYINGEMEIMPVSKFSIHPNCEEWEVFTKNGRKVVCSQDHSLALLDPDTLEVVKTTAKQSVGLCSPTMRSLLDPCLFSCFAPNDKLHNSSRPLPKEIPLSHETGWFIGVTIGDGWVTDKTKKDGPGVRHDAGTGNARSVHLASGQNGEAVRSAWESIASSISNAPSSSLNMPHSFGSSDCVSIRSTVSSTALGLWLEPLIGKGARGKHLPVRFLEMPEEFRRGLFCGLIDTDGTANWNARGQFALSFTSTSAQLSEEIMLLGLSLGLPSSKTEYVNRDLPAFVVTFSIRPVQDARWIRLVTEYKQKAVEELWGSEAIQYGRNDFVPMTDRAREELLSLLQSINASARPPNRNDAANSQYNVLRRKESILTRMSAEKLRALVGGLEEVSDYLKKWFKIALDPTVGWDQVVSANPTGQKKEMYDLTVPDSWTFTMADGLVVWDTCALTVPMSKAAVEEVKKMYPSNNIFSPASYGVMPVPVQETLLGLHLISKWGKDTGKTFKDIGSLASSVNSGETHITDAVKVTGMFGGKPTTYGRILLESRMPRKFEKSPEILHDTKFEITSKNMSGVIAPMLAKGHFDDFARTADGLKDLGNEHVYKLGFSVGLKDIAPLKDRDRIINEAHKKVNDLGKTIKDKETFAKKSVEIYSKATEELIEAIKKHVKETDNRFGTLVTSGAKGKIGQLQQIIAAPMLMRDSLNNIISTPVTRSYAEGLDIGSYWITQHGARKGTVQKTLSSQEPGALTKDIQNATMGTLITSNDCGTRSGILLGIVPDPNDPAYKDVHDRFLAQSVKLKNETIKEGTLITPELMSKMRNNKVSKVVVRSPLKCEHGDGICAKCYGIAEHGKLHPIGTNIGVLAGSSMGEPATQMVLDSFHSGGVAAGRGGASVDRITRLEALLKMPETVKHQATVATSSGKVTHVHEAESGGVRITVDGVAHYVPRQLVNPDIKVGTEIKKGDSLSGGYLNPHHLLAATKDIHAVQNYLTKELHEGLFDSEGVRRRNIEVAVRSLTNLSKVIDPGHGPYESGDIIPRSVAEEHNKNLEKGQAPMIHHPFLKGSEQIPALLTKSWMGRLNYRELQKTILEAAGKGEKAELHDSHPIGGVMYGAEFGKPPSNKPKHVY